MDGKINFFFALTNQIKRRSAADVLCSAWVWKVQRRTMLPVASATDSFTVPTVAEAASDVAKWMKEMSMRMPRLMVGMEKKKQGTASKCDRSEEIDGRMNFGKEWK